MFRYFRKTWSQFHNFSVLKKKTFQKCKRPYFKFHLSNLTNYILGIFTEKPYSNPLERNVVYIQIITFSHATSHDFKWRQNKP